MGEIIFQTEEEYKEGYLHYCKNVDGKIAVGRAKMGRGSKKK